MQPLHLKPILVEAPFMQWGLDFIGEINPVILNVAQMDTHGHRLLHEMDISNPHKESYRHSHHPISGDKHLVKIWIPYQDHNRKRSHIQVQEDGEVLSKLQ
jgi:hypothetical protein